MMIAPLMHAQAAVNYLVLWGTATNSSVTMTAQISANCPLVAGTAGGYTYYGTRQSIGFVTNGNLSDSAVMCVVGVPSSITLTPLGTLSNPVINLSLGGPTQTLMTYMNGIYPNVGILMPDQSAVFLGTFGAWHLFRQVPTGIFYNTFTQMSSVDVNGVPAVYTISTGYYAGINYALGY